MDHQPRSFLGWGIWMLVLVALFVISSSSQASSQSVGPIPPNLSAIQNFDSSSMEAALCPVHAGPLTKFASNPVLNIGAAGTWSEYGVSSPSVVYYNSLYRMWYAGTNASFISAIGYASSSNGTSWTPYASNPVLTASPGGTWEANGINFPSVIYDYGAGEYKMWYAGNGNGTRSIGLATSSDGITWTKYAGNPVLTKGSAGEWDQSRVSNPSVTKIAGVYHMWYSAQIAPQNGIGHATSPDGITWTKDAANPVLQGEADAWDVMIFAPAVVYDNCIFHMWYTGCNGDGNLCRLGYARSSDGVRWRKLGVALPLGGAGTFDQELVGYASGMIGDPHYRIWYTGSAADEKYRIGFAMGQSLNKFIFLPVTSK